MSTGESAAAPGWYHGEGDPPGSERYWDGIQWVGQHRPIAAPLPPPPSVPASVRAPEGAASAGLSPTFDTSSGSATADLRRLGLVLASPGARMAARAIDWVILAAVSIVFVVLFIASARGGDGVGAGIVAWALVVGLGGAAYEVCFVALAGGTPGKLALGIRVATMDGAQPPGWGPALGRWVLALVSWIPLLGQLALLGIWVASFILLFSDPQRRTLFDRVGGTVVVKA